MTNRKYSLLSLAALTLGALTILVAALLTGGPESTGPAGGYSAATGEENRKRQILENYGKLPISFEPNEGQTDPAVRFLANGVGYSMRLTDTGADIHLTARAGEDVRTAAVLMRMENARSPRRVYGIGRTQARSNYFIGRDRSRWKTGVPNFEKVRYEQVYEGVDLVYYGNRRQLEYDFVVAPEADPGQIRLRFSGLRDARLDAETGDLVLETGTGEIRQHRPYTYQTVDGRRKEIRSSYRLEQASRDADGGEYLVSFELAAYDRSQELVIDPILVYGSYLGGSQTDRGTGIAVDAAGHAYITGTAVSRDFPTTAGSLKPELLPRTGTTGSYWADSFVTKFSPDGSQLVFSTYFGGRNGSESGSDIAVASDGSIYFSGSTTSGDLPTVNAYQTAFGGTDDAFAAKLSPDGSALVYATYLGGFNTEIGGRLALDQATGETTYIGRTYSPDFPTTPGVLKEKLCTSAQTCSGTSFTGSYIARLAADGTVRFATLFSGGLNDVALDADANAVIAGTGSPALTTPGAYRTTTTGGIEGYLGKLSPDGTRIVFGTLLGGGLESDVITGVALDAAQNMYVTGQTENSGFPTTPGAFDRTFNSTGTLEDGFVTKFDPAGSALVYSTFIGGIGKDQPKDIALGSDGGVYIVGETTAPASYPKLNSLLNTGSIFLTRFDPAGSALVYSTLLGQGGGYALAVDGGDNAYITGQTYNVPVTPGAFQTARGGSPSASSDDAFVLKIGPDDETAVRYAISGTVTDENQGFNNNYAPVVVTITGAVNRSIELPYNGGQYYFGSLPAGGDYTVTVSKAGFETEPGATVFNDLGANQFADFTILRNREPEGVITAPAYGDTYEAPASVTIRANASDPDGDAIRKVEFVAYSSATGNIPIGTDTEAPYEITWTGVQTGTWALYAFPYDEHGLRGISTPVVHVFVNEANGPAVSLTSPAEGDTFRAGEYIPFSVETSASVTRVEYYAGENLIASSTQRPFSRQIRFTETGDRAIRAKAYNSQNQSTESNVANISVVPFNHTISGRISNSLDLTPVSGVTVNLTSPTDPSISGTTTTDANGEYRFTDIFGAWDDVAVVTPASDDYDFEPESRSMTIGFSDHPDRNFLAVPVTGITVEMTSPSNSQQFPHGATVPLAADASSTSGAIAKVEFYRYEGGQRTLLATDTEAPYAFDWEGAGSGYHTVHAWAHDVTGDIAQSGSVTFRVAEAPTVVRLRGVITDANGNWMPGITVRLNGTAGGQTIEQTSISNTFGAYGFFNLPAGGDYTITPEGGGGTTFTPPSFSVTNATQDNTDINFQASAVNQAPAVTIDSPTDGAVFTMPGSIRVTASATDPDGQVTHFTLTATGNNRSTRIGEVNTGSFDAPWEPSAPGEYVISATARDNGGRRTTEEVTITVNPPPPVSISGRIVDRASAGIAGVTLTLENLSDETAAELVAQTDENGSYVIRDVPTFSSYRLKAAKLNYTFAPQRREYFNLAADLTDADFTGTLQVQTSDFDGDGGSDVAVWRPSNGVWHLDRSNAGYTSMQFGGADFGDIPVPGNYDGDQMIDVAVYRGGTWYVRRSSDGQVDVRQFGLATDRTVPGDYDGDGRTDLAVWRPENGVWYIWRSSDGSYDIRQFGLSGDVPLVGDYDGDGRTDLAVWRPATGVWYVLRSSDGDFRAYQFGQDGDTPLVGDFDGDKLADYAIYRPQTGVWYVLRSSDGGFTILKWGIETDVPVPGDYDRDGRTDFAVYRRSEGNWYIYNSANGDHIIRKFGIEEDVPVPAALNSE